MSLRRKFILYLLLVHLPFVALAVYLLLNDRVWLIALELVLATSFVLGLKLVRGVFETVNRVRDGAMFIADGDFTTRLREVGHTEMDQLIRVYNRMVDTLREERTRQQEQNYFLEKLMAASPLGVVTFDFDGRITAVNPEAERMLQCPAGELAGRTLAEAGERIALALGEMLPGDTRVVAISGQRRIKCQWSEFHDRGFARPFVTMTELTRELRQSEKAAYEKLIRMTSHEVNNTIAATNSILTSCLNYGGQLGPEDREDFETGLRAVIARTDRLNEFVRGFAEVVRLPEPKLSSANMRDIAESVLDLMRVELQRRGIGVAWNERARCLPAMVDRIQMEQALVNIVKNAMEAAGDGGTITIHLDERSLVVEDSGPGIPPDVRPQLFTPFFTTKPNGQGIGLTLVREILTRHGFDYSLDGPPTRFVIRWPV